MDSERRDHALPSRPARSTERVGRKHEEDRDTQAAKRALPLAFETGRRCRACIVVCVEEAGHHLHEDREILAITLAVQRKRSSVASATDSNDESLRAACEYAVLR